MIDPIILTSFLRNMLFTMPVQVVAFKMVGLSFAQIVELEALLLFSKAAAHPFAGHFCDRYSPKLCFSLGKTISALACVLIAFGYSSYDLLAVASVIWGLGAGMSETSEFLALKNKSESWLTSIRKNENLGIAGSIVAFLAGPLLLGSVGFAGLFITNGAFSLLTAITLLTGRREQTRVALKLENEPQESVTLAAALRAIAMPLVGFAIITACLKIAALEFQNQLLLNHVDPNLYGVIFAVLSLVLIAITQFSSLRKIALVDSALAIGIVIYAFMASVPTADLLLATMIFFFARISQRLLFMNGIMVAAPANKVGSIMGFANLSASLVIFGASKLMNHQGSNVLAVGSLFAASIAIYHLTQRTASSKKGAQVEYA